MRAYGPAAALAELEVEREGQSLRLRPRNGWRDGRLLLRMLLFAARRLKFV